MPATFTITPDALGYRLGRRNAELTFFVALAAGSQAATKAEVHTYVDDSGDIPASINNLDRDDFDIEELRSDLWRVVVRYSTTEKKTTPVRTAGDSTFSFETRGATQHIVASRSTVNSYAAPGEFLGGTAPNFKQLIGVSEQGPQGTDIVVPTYSWQETHWFAPATVDSTYKATLFSLTGTINDNTYKGFAAGENLFLGAAGTRRGTTDNDLWEVSFAFAAAPNLTGLSIGDITGIVKAGHDYLWVRYKEVVDATNKIMIFKPAAAYVERVYRTGNHTNIGIGS